MNTKNQTNLLKTNTQFLSQGALARSVEACRLVAARFNQLKNQLVRRLATEAAAWIPENLVQKAVVEAEALAWSTPYPLLFLPALAEEKVMGAAQWANRQQMILQRAQGLAGH